MPIQAVETAASTARSPTSWSTLIANGEYEPGARLPPERDLAKQLGVSRPSVREALIALEVEGLRRSARRLGRLRDAGRHAQRGRDASCRPTPGPFELIRARWLIESECAALAARDGTTAQLRAIEQAYDAMIATPARRPMSWCSRATACSTSASPRRRTTARWSLVVRTLWDQRMGPLFMRFENHFTRPETWTTVNAEHEAVFDAIMRRDAREARTAMRRHMDNAAKRFNEGFRTSATPARVRNKAARKAR